MRVAIPRALHYHYFFPGWEAFWKALGHEVAVTPPTDRSILERGSAACLADICLPVKAWVGHLEAAKGLGDAVFVPRLVSVDPARYYCPKFLALPDLAKAKVPELRVLSFEVNAKKRGGSMREGLVRLARETGASSAAAEQAALAAGAAQAARESEARWRFQTEFLSGAGARIAVIGHPYVAEDPALSSGVMAWLAEHGAKAATYDMVPGAPGGTAETGLLREIYWECAHALAHAALRLLARPDVDGMILLSAFGCGPDSFTSDIVGRRARKIGSKPFVRLVFDEHTAREGVVTRLEAFLDMVAFREKGDRSLFPGATSCDARG